MRPVKVSASDFYGGVCVEFGSQKGEQIRVLSWSDLDSRGVLVGKLQKIIEEVFSAGVDSGQRLTLSSSK